MLSLKVEVKRGKEMKLSETQEKVLDKMKNGKWYSSYELQCSLATMHALRNRYLVTSKSGPGAFAFPQNGIMWKLKEEENETV